MTEYAEFSFRNLTQPGDYGLEASRNERLSRDDALKKFKELISADDSRDYGTLDDKFLMRFLNARKMKVDESLVLLNNYFAYREKNKDLFDSLSINDSLVQQALYEGFPGVLPEKDRKGRCVLLFFCNNWEAANYPLEVVYRALLLTLEALLEDSANQVNGFIIIVDWTDVTFSQVMSISPRTLKLMVEGLQDCFPARFKGVHFVNQPWYVERFLNLIKTFLKEKTSKRIFVHGNNLCSLHSHVTPAILPSELGGECPPFSPTNWAHSLVFKSLN